jgi:Rrf2 family protein
MPQGGRGDPFEGIGHTTAPGRLPEGDQPNGSEGLALWRGPLPARHHSIYHNGPMRLTVKSDYAIRALAELAARSDGTTPMRAAELAEAQDIPPRFLLGILAELRKDGLIASQRGADGGFIFRRAPKDITLADIIRAVDGPLAQVGDDRPGEVTYVGAAAALTDVWVAVRASLRAVLEKVTLADLAAGKLPASVTRLTKDPDTWEPH